MRNQPSPLESLAAIALTFAVGALLTSLVGLYGKRMYRQGRADGK